MTYHLQVYGFTYEGFRSCYQYTINEPIMPLSDVAAVKRLAPDFESLIDYRIVKETNEYEPTSRGLSRRIDTFKTLRGWRTFSNRRYSRCVNA